MDNSGPGPATPAEVPAEPAAEALPGQIAELVGEIRNSVQYFATLPDRVPIAIPEFGVKPIVVSTLLPASMAASEQPFPRWQLMVFSEEISRPSICAARCAQYS